MRASGDGTSALSASGWRGVERWPRAAHTAGMPRPPRQALLPLVLLVLLPLALLAPALAPGHALVSVSTEQLSPWRASTPPERLAELREASRPLAADKTLMFEPQLR